VGVLVQVAYAGLLVALIAVAKGPMTVLAFAGGGLCRTGGRGLQWPD
jgi:hypothetical protein